MVKWVSTVVVEQKLIVRIVMEELMNVLEVRAIRLIVAIAEGQERIHVLKHHTVLIQAGEHVQVVEKKVNIELGTGHVMDVR